MAIEILPERETQEDKQVMEKTCWFLTAVGNMFDFVLANPAFTLVSPNAIDSFVNNFDITSRLKNSGEFVVLTCNPKSKSAKDNYAHVDIMLSTKSNLPICVRFTDSGKTKRTVYRLSDARMNFPEAPQEKDFWPDSDYQIRIIGSSQTKVTN